VVGGLGSLAGAFLASLLIGVMQTFAVAIDQSLGSMLLAMGVALSAEAQAHELMRFTLSMAAPMLPFLLLVLVLIFRPQGLLGNRYH